MNRDKALELLRNGPIGVEEWNRQRDAERTRDGPDLPEVRPVAANLTGANLFEAILIKADLAGANLDGANLAGANLTGANLFEAILIKADLAGANLDGANLAGANLTEADFADARLAGADLTRANLTGANLAEAILIKADLAGADLAGADLSLANLAGADLSGANLTEANLTGVNLAGARLRWVRLTGAGLAKADLIEANLIRADLTGADLTGADLTGADLTEGNLTGADLTEAILIKADLAGADLTRARLTRANLTRADLRSIRFGPEHPILNDSSETIKWGYHITWLNWQTLRRIGEFPLFGVSWTGLAVSLVVINALGAINERKIVQQWVGTPVPIPERMWLILLASLLLVLGSTLYKLGCPRDVRAFSEEEWVTAHRQPRLLYLRQRWQRRWLQVPTLTFSVGGAGLALFLIVERVVLAVHYLLTTSR